jgi:hypothetical protein
MIIVASEKDGSGQTTRYWIRGFNNGRVPPGTSEGPFTSIHDVLHLGFGDMLKPSIQAELKDHLEIKGFYMFDPADAFQENFG